MAETLQDGTVLLRSGPAHAPAAVLIHGLGLNRECWQWTVPALLDTGFQVIAYDLYGHGQSAPPPETPSLALFSRQLRKVLDHCGAASAAVAGFSLGGMIGRRFAQDHPDKVAALAILFSPHNRTPEAQTAILKRVEQARASGPQSTVEAALERWFTATHRAVNPAQIDLVRSWVLANDPSVYHTIYRVLADGIDEIVAPQPPIACPTFVMTGDEDFGNGPEMSEAIAAEIAGAELHILKGVRHMALAENPGLVNGPLVAFLRRTFAEEASS
ncbi:alpha/beta fold hydrolase (plasmid) [Aminobacter sp. SR38]|jgi:pimeloyl-ACP methyl ester carboxylesterase|uniref:alpha/beta fold hydrolase n=1 Tax=Aminobacter sp. SR38 TaxID=2774562 RepID=UPI00177A9031|nr:alpha/beta hydrolase [Aminobacter sp. SR38]QOF75065.1 alpha/beta fold hydrolase [Aminobacter sp. SR38]